MFIVTRGRHWRCYCPNWGGKNWQWYFQLPFYWRGPIYSNDKVTITNHLSVYLLFLCFYLSLWTSEHQSEFLQVPPWVWSLYSLYFYRQLYKYECKKNLHLRNPSKLKHDYLKCFLISDWTIKYKDNVKVSQPCSLYVNVCLFGWVWVNFCSHLDVESSLLGTVPSGVQSWNISCGRDSQFSHFTLPSVSEDWSTLAFHRDM